MATTKRKDRDWLEDSGAYNSRRTQAKATLDDLIICARYIRLQPSTTMAKR